MLLPVSVGPGLGARFDEPSLDGVQNVGGHSCARVSGCTPSKDATVLWIDRGTYLLRRIVVTRLTLEVTTSYEPSLDPIDVGSIERPDVERTPAQPRQPVPWTGIDLEIDSRRVETVYAGSPAAQLGVQIGDEVEVMNGRPMRDFGDALKTLHYLRIGERLALTIRRGDERLNFILVVQTAPSPVRPPPSAPLVE
jgi:membrane-associated protease RseP (regulator of RpoE activity)